MLKQLSIIVPLIKTLKQMPDYAKLMEDMVKNKRSVSFKDDDRMHHCSAIATWFFVKKKEDSNTFNIPCTIWLQHISKALIDFDASIDLMTLSIYKKLG